jgi:hypothetical protein
MRKKEWKDVYHFFNCVSLWECEVIRRTADSTTCTSVSFLSFSMRLYYFTDYLFSTSRWKNITMQVIHTVKPYSLGS